LPCDCPPSAAVSCVLPSACSGQVARACSPSTPQVDAARPAARALPPSIPLFRGVPPSLGAVSAVRKGQRGDFAPCGGAPGTSRKLAGSNRASREGGNTASGAGSNQRRSHRAPSQTRTRAALAARPTHPGTDFVAVNSRASPAVPVLPPPLIGPSRQRRRLVGAVSRLAKMQALKDSILAAEAELGAQRAWSEEGARGLAAVCEAVPQASVPTPPAPAAPHHGFGTAPLARSAA
jgi:hypothetical protein